MSDLKNDLKRCFLSQTLFRNYLCSFLIVGLVFLLFYLLDIECNSNQTETETSTTTTTTTVTTGPGQTCHFSIGAHTSENGSISGLIPGTIYQIFFNCLNCCKEVTTSKSVCFVESLIFQTLTMWTTSTCSIAADSACLTVV